MMSQKNNSYSLLASLDKKVDKETKKTNKRKEAGVEVDYKDYDIPNRSYGDLYCEVCDSHMNSEPMWDSHISGKRHQKNKKKDCEADKKYTHLVEDATCQKQFDALDTPIVGLDSLCEIRRPGSKPFYQCYLCCASVPTVHALIEHVTNQKHLSAYLKDKDPAKYSTIMSSGLGAKHLTPLIVECSIELEKSHGRGKIKVKKENPKPPDEYHKYKKDNDDFGRKKRKLEDPDDRSPEPARKQEDFEYENRGRRQVDERYRRDDDFLKNRTEISKPQNEELLKEVAIYRQLESARSLRYDDDLRSSRPMRYDDDPRPSRSMRYDDDPRPSRSMRYDDDPRPSRYIDDARPPSYQNESRQPRYEEPKQPRFEESKQQRFEEPRQSRYEESKQSRYEEANRLRYEDSKHDSNSSRPTDTKTQEISKSNSPQSDPNSEFSQLTSEGLLQRIINLSMQNLMSIMYYALSTKDITVGDLPALKKLSKKVEELYANKSIEAECARMQQEKKTTAGGQINNGADNAVASAHRNMFLASNPPVRSQNLLLQPTNLLQQPQNLLQQPQNLLQQPQNLLQQLQNQLQQPQQTPLYQQLSASLTVPQQGNPGFVAQTSPSQNITNTWQELMNPKSIGNSATPNVNSLFNDYMKRF